MHATVKVGRFGSVAAGLVAGALVLMAGLATSLARPEASDREWPAASAGLAPGEDQPGGAATSRHTAASADAFSHFSPNMGFSRELDFKIGNALFRKLWVQAPSSTKSSDGLGPLYNARACQACHLKDGRGHPPSGPGLEDRSVSMFLRLSVPPSTEAERKALTEGRISVVPEPTYGGQLQELGVANHAGEGRMVITYTEERETLAGGEIVTLRRPTYSIVDLGYGPLAPAAMVSPRMTPQMIGLGLLEAVPEAEILAREDPDDRDGDGISGRANRVWSVEHNRTMLGRFGWKAGQPTVLQQSAEAFAGDIGIGSWMVPRAYGDCTVRQQTCREAVHGDTSAKPNEEIPAKMLDLVGFYARNLAVPARRDPTSPDVLAGRAMFHGIGCAACHVPSYVTGTSSPDVHLHGQRIWPYTDLLLHDMGEGLADHRPEGRADGREWRTAPLWGIGLTHVVNGHTFFLHDGRARSVTEAILWHGGEAQRARDAFATLAPEDRQRLLAFVNSL
ncbi:MAG: di-heme oxidoredictase family protein [Hyphomicrobiaceae bacterium]